MSLGRWLKAALLVVAVSLVVTAVWQLPISRWIVALADRIRGMGFAGVLLFIAVYVVAEVALLPGSIFTLAAGFAYGPVGGLLVASPASVIAATAAFLLSRTALRSWIQQKIVRSQKAKALDRAVGQNSFKLIFLLRLSPVIPFNILNYALGLTDVTLGRYLAASFIGMLPGTWLYVYLGSLATTAASLGDPSHSGGTSRLALTIVGFVATIAVVVLATRLATRALHDELDKEPA